MPIPASQIVSVSPRLISAGGNDLEFNALFLTDTSLIPVDQFVLSFASADDVAGYFGGDSDEYKLASRYFLGYSDSFTKPKNLFIAPICKTDLAAFIRGGTVSKTLAEIQTLTTASLTVVMGGKTATLSNLDFSSATSFSNVALIIQSALNQVSVEGAGTVFTAASVTYSSVFKAFTITSGVLGKDDSLTVYPSGTVSEYLALSQAHGAILSKGTSAMTPTQVMNKVTEMTRNFVTFMSIDTLTKDQTVEFTEWSSNQGVNYLHVWWDTNVALEQTSPVNTIAQAIEDGNFGSSVGVYGNAEYGAFVCSVAASIDYDRTNGTITFKFKGQSGLGANVTNGTVAKNLEANGMNFVGNYATRNDDFVFFANGAMFGEYKWIDSYLNAVWLNNAIQVACMTGFANVARVPYTEAGYTIVRSWIQDPVNRALKSGIIDTGVELSEAQKAQVTREAGRDISSELYTDGYVIQVKDPGATVRAQRGTPEASIWYCYGGSIHKLEVASTMIE